MNKIKLLYDVVKVLKNKEKIDGVLTAQVQKDQQEIFSLRNEFSKNGSATKTTVSCELNLDGKQVKRESSTEFSGSSPCCHGGMLRGFFRGRHHHGDHGHHQHHNEGCGRLKTMLSRVSCVFGLLSSLQVEEKAGGAAVISMNLAEIPEEMQTTLRDKLNQHASCHPQNGVMGPGHSIDSLSGLLLLTVNQEREIEKIALHLESKLAHEEDGPTALRATADVQFAW
jgi:hypothetical protein